LTRVEKSIEIKASPQKVWPMMWWDGWTQWYAPFKEGKVEYTSREKNKVGTTVHVTAELAGIKGEFDGENTEAIENEKVAWRTTGGNFTGFGVNALSPTKAGTKVTIMMDYELPYSILGKIIDKLRFHKALEKAIETGLNKLKDMMEK
jgi:uncharacterized membrane protein